MHLIRLVAFVVLFIYSSASPISYPIPKARASTSGVEPSYSNASPLVLRNLQAAPSHDTSTEELLKKQQSSSSVASEPTASSHAPAGTIIPLSSVPRASTRGASSQPAATTPDSTPTAETSSAQHTSSTSRAVGTVVPITDAFPHSTTENHETSSSPTSLSMPVVVVVGASSTETDSSLLATTSSSNTQINSLPSPTPNSMDDSIPSTETLITTITHTEPCSTTSAPPPSSTEEKRMFSIDYSSTSTETLDPVITPAAEFSPDSSGLSMEEKRMFSINYSSTSTEDLDSFFITRADSSSEITPTPTTVVVTASHTGSKSSSSTPSSSSFTPDMMFPLIQLWWEATGATVSPSASANASATNN